MQLSRVISSVNRLSLLRGITRTRAVSSPRRGEVDLTSRPRYLLIAITLHNSA